MSAGHTPGPWNTVSPDPWTVDHDHFGSITYIGVGTGAGDPLALVVAKDRYDNSPELTANARLIAAAPELLEALIAVTPSPHLGESEYHKKFYAAARAAIAKARGEQGK